MNTLLRALAPLSLLLAAAPAAAQSAPVPAGGAPQIGFIGMGLNVADMDRSMKFYVDGLGMKALRRNERGEVVEQFLGYPATPYPPMLELLSHKTPATPAPPATVSFKIVLSVDNVEAINAQLRRAGFSPPPVRMNPLAGGGAFMIRDPDGYNLEIVQRPAAPPK